MCEDPTCRAKRFIVYADEVSLMAHNAKEHNVKGQVVPLDFKIQSTRGFEGEYVIMQVMAPHS